MHKKVGKKKLRLFLILTTIVLLLSVLVGSVYNDWKQILANRRLERELNLKYESLMDNQEKLTAEIAKLGESEGLINYARENFMLSTDGDLIIKWDKKDNS